MNKENLKFLYMEELLSSINLTTGCLAQDDAGRLVFLAQEKDDWVTKGDTIHIPFGGIGGKVEKTSETPLGALIREISEEVAGDLKIERLGRSVVFCDNLGNFLSERLDLDKLIKKRFPDKIKPQLVIANIYNVTNYSQFKPALIGVYKASIYGAIYPKGENPCLLHLDYPLLVKSYRQTVDLNQIRQKGKITTNSILIQESTSLAIKFFPIGDARVLAILATKGVRF